MTTIHTDHDGRFYDYTTRGLVEYTTELLAESDVILRVHPFGPAAGDLDGVTADMLQVLGVMHDETGIDLERLPQVRAFCIVVLDEAGWSE